MEYRLIQAANMKQAMVKIHQEMGPDALIYRTRKTIGGIEILAGLPVAGEKHSSNISSVNDMQVLSDAGDCLLEDRIEELNKKIEALSHTIEHGNQRNKIRISRKNILPVLKRFIQRIRLSQRKLMSEGYHLAKNQIMGISSILHAYGLKGKYRIAKVNAEVLNERYIRALVGPSGVGKTSTIIKLAVQFSSKYDLGELGIISTNVDDIYIKSKLLHFCDLYHVDFMQVNHADGLNQAIDAMTGKRLVLIDTHGIAQRDVIAINKQKALLEKSRHRIDVYLVLSASQQAEVIEDCIKYYRFKRITGCILTKVDEAIALEPALSAIVKCKLSVSYVTNGEDLDSDIYTLNHNYQSEHNVENIIDFGMREFTTQSINWI